VKVVVAALELEVTAVVEELWNVVDVCAVEVV